MKSTRVGSGELEQWSVSLLQRREVLRLVVGAAIDPAAEEDADPFERQGTERGVSRGALGTMKAIELLGPERLGDALGGPLHERLANELGGSKTPVHPVLLAAALGHGRHSSVALEGTGIGEALAELPEGGEEASPEDRSRARQSAKERVFIELGTQGLDFVTEALDGRRGGTKLRQQELDSELAGVMTAGSEVSGCSLRMAAMRRLIAEGRTT